MLVPSQIRLSASLLVNVAVGTGLTRTEFVSTTPPVKPVILYLPGVAVVSVYGFEEVVTG